MFSDGEIKGANFGMMRSWISVHIRVKPSRRVGNYVNYGDRLLGDLNASNVTRLDDTLIQHWSDTSIQLKFPPGYKQDKMSTINREAKRRSWDPPLESDLEVGYQIGESEWIYP